MRLAYERAFFEAARRIVVAAIFNWQRRQARRAGVKKPKGGAISFAQRFASNLSLHPHLHLVIPDGVFFANSFGQAQFHTLPKPKVEDLENIASRIYRRIGRWLEQHPVLEEPRDGLAMSYASSEKVRPLPLFPLPERPKHPGKLEARVEGFSLEVGRHVHPNDREALERLCKYGARPPLDFLRPRGANSASL